MRLLPAAFTVFGTVLLTLSLPHTSHAQFRTPPTVDGVIGANEYGNEYRSTNTSDPNLTWRMTWDANNLYIAVQDANLDETATIYLDSDPALPVNGETGTVTGFEYAKDRTTRNLPFAADVAITVKRGLQELRTYDRQAGIWRTAVPLGGNYADGVQNSENQVREFSIPWSVFQGRPENFNWFGYISYGSGIFGAVPIDNPTAINDGTISFLRYFTVLNTAAGSDNRAFGPNGVDSYSHSGLNDNTFGSITVYDFTLNTPNAFITRAGAGSAWDIRGDLRVGNGSLNLGASTASVSVAGDLIFADPATFTAGNASVFLVGNGDRTINGDTYSTLTINGTGTKTLTGDNLIIENSLALNNGTLATGPFLVDLRTTGSLAETAGYLLGNVQATRSIVGPGRYSFGGIGLAISTSGAPGSVTAQRVTGGFGIDGTTNQNKTIRRRFFLNAPGNPTVNSTIEFTYRNANPNELEGNDPANLALYRSTNGRTGPYSQVALASDNTPGTTKTFSTALALDGSFYSLADGKTPLPVELVSFTGKAESSAVRLNWATASELQNKGFDIEHRTELSEWKKLGFVSGHGTSNQRHTYTYLDRSAGAGTNYYRLRQTDLDGKSVYSQPATVQLGAVAFSLSPVPATDVLTLHGLGAGQQTAEVYNTSGQRVLSQTFSDATATSLTVSALPVGVYMVRVLGPDRSVRQARFIKQ